MNSLTIVRHAQASFYNDNYDSLSPLGAAQARALGEYWLEIEQTFDRIVVGPLERHQQTYDYMAAAFAEARIALPKPTILDEFAEHQGVEVVQRAVEREAMTKPELRKFLTPKQEWDRATLTSFWRYYQKIAKAWIAGEWQDPGVESWQAFHERVLAGLQKLKSFGKGKTRIVLFTSGGPLSVAAGHALGLSDLKTQELSWFIHNTGYSVFLFSRDRFSMLSHNCLPHLTDPAKQTHV